MRTDDSVRVARTSFLRHPPQHCLLMAGRKIMTVLITTKMTRLALPRTVS
jgi:hypothetical protein